MRRSHWAYLLGTSLALAACADGHPDVRPVTSVSGLQISGYDKAYEDGKAHLAAGRNGLAVVAFGRALAMNPDSVAALNAMGAAYDQLRRYDIAQAYYKKALRLEPDSADTLNNMAVSLQLAGKPEAHEFLERARHLAPSNDTIRVNLARVESEDAKPVRQVAEAPSAAPAAPLKDAGQTDNDRPRIERSGISEFRLMIPTAAPSGSTAATAPSAAAGATFPVTTGTVAADDRPKADQSQRPDQLPAQVKPEAAALRDTPTASEVRGDRREGSAAADAAERPKDPPASAQPVADAAQARAAAAGAIFPVTIETVTADDRRKVDEPRGPNQLPAPAKTEVAVLGDTPASSEAPGARRDASAAADVAARLKDPPASAQRVPDVEQARATAAGATFPVTIEAVTADDRSKFDEAPGPDQLPARANIEVAALSEAPVSSALPGDRRGGSAAAYAAVALREAPVIAQPVPDATKAPAMEGVRARAEIAALDLESQPVEPAVSRDQVRGRAPRVEISNGAGRLRMAARFRTFLQERSGSSAARLTNARPFNHETSVLLYRKGWKAEAEKLSALLPVRLRMAADDAIAEDIVIILGRDLLAFDGTLRGRT